MFLVTSSSKTMAGTNFIGKWKSEMSKADNFMAFVKVSGLPEEYIEPWRTSSNVITFQREGDSLQNYKWKLVHDSSIMGIRTYEFTSGVEVTTTDPQGGPLKYCITFESDTEMTETEASEGSKWVVMRVKRKVVGDKIMETTESHGVVMTNQYDRVS